MFEDDNVNTMQDALNLFENVSNQRWFDNTPIILFLNKKDLFAHKILEHPLTECESFSDYIGTQDFEACSEYIKQQFIQRAPPKKHIDFYITTATDPLNVEMVFKSVAEIVLKQNIKESYEHSIFFFYLSIYLYIYYT